MWLSTLTNGLNNDQGTHAMIIVAICRPGRPHCWGQHALEIVASDYIATRGERRVNPGLKSG